MRDRGIASPTALEDDKLFEASLRPGKLDEFTGQTKLKENLAIAIEAARRRGDAMDHVLLYGPPGPKCKAFMGRCDRSHAEVVSIYDQ
jgi:holliday junction DNA helicase RuvB